VRFSIGPYPLVKGKPAGQVPVLTNSAFERLDAVEESTESVEVPRANSAEDQSEAPPPSRLLDAIDRPEAVKALTSEQLPQLAQELRDEIITICATYG
jgi:hypothetical protein